MVGVCAAFGDEPLSNQLVDGIRWRDDETSVSYDDERFSFAGSFHRILAGEQPAEAADGDVLLWVWGDIYGFESDGDYHPRTSGTDGNATFCAQLFDRHGIDFVSGLNGDFALVVYDQNANELSFVTDRFATRPLFHARTDDGLVVASNLQTLTSHPTLDWEFDEAMLYEYFQLRRVFGIETPITGVREFPPASVVTIDLDDRSTDTWTYWTPRYDPIDAPVSYFQDRLAELVVQIMSEWTHDELDYGVLLSGGTDSRFISAAMDRPTVAFHNADWFSREAKTAKQVADICGDEFELLRRWEHYDADLLKLSPKLSNFSGWFDQAYFLGFEEQITSRVDALVTGLYADMLFGDGPLALHKLRLGDFGTVSLPASKPIESIDDYVSKQIGEAIEPLPYFSADRSIEETLRDSIHRTDDGVVSHGVHYESLRELILFGDFYPMGGDTDAIFSRTLMHMCPYRTPFLDNRIIDLSLQLPMSYRVRSRVVNGAVERLAPEVAEIPHARTGLPLTASVPKEFVAGNITAFWRKHVTDQTPPAPHLDHDPWPNRRELLRVQPFALESLRENETLIRNLPFLDMEGALMCHREHIGGRDNMTVLYSLLTFLEMPVAAGGHGAAVPSTIVSTGPGERPSRSLDGGD